MHLTVYYPVFNTRAFCGGVVHQGSFSSLYKSMSSGDGLTRCELRAWHLLYDSCPHSCSDPAGNLQQLTSNEASKQTGLTSGTFSFFRGFPMEPFPLCSTLARAFQTAPSAHPIFPLLSVPYICCSAECLTCYQHWDRHPKAANDMITEGITEAPYGNFQTVAIIQQDSLALKLHNMSADNNFPFWCGGRT